jgi:hypothetical protein
MTRNQLADFIKEKDVYIENFENLTKKKIIRKVIDYIEYREFWTEYYS